MSETILLTYEEAGQLNYGIFQENINGACKILKLNGETSSVPFVRCYLLPATSLGINEIPDLITRAQEMSSAFSCEKIWNKYKGLPSINATEACLAEFEENNTTNHLATYLALINDGLFFKRKTNQFHPRTSEVIEELKRSRLEKGLKEEELQQTINHFLNNEIAHDKIPDSSKRIINNLKLLAVHSHHLSPSDRREATHLLNSLKEKYALSDTLEHQALMLLKKTTIIGEREHLIFNKHLWPENFSRKAQAEARKVAANPKEYLAKISRAKDLTGLYCVTVDDAKTRDIDDAVSIRETESGIEVGIHISLVAALTEPGSACDLEARDRATSIYTADRIFNMLPEDISENSGSLWPDQIRPALSCLLNCDREGNIADYKISIALIKSAGRISYEEVQDKLNNKDPFFELLSKVTSAHEKFRRQNNAISSQKSFSEVSIDDCGVLKLKCTDEKDAARNLIAELMIIANRYFADFSARNFIPVFFRGQEDEREEEKSDEAEQTFAPSYIDLTPQKHSGLGLPAYIQATSPIRRYQDLCNQRQLLSFLINKKPFYQRKEMERIQRQIFHPLKTAAQITKECRRFWMLQYLKENYQTGHVFDAFIIRNDKKQAMIQLKDLKLISLCTLPKELQAKTSVQLRMLKVGPAMNQLELELVAP